MSPPPFIAFEEFARRADALRAQIAAACAAAGRDPRDVELLAVTKTHPAAAADYAARYGLRGVGENRVQEAREKQLALGLRLEAREKSLEPRALSLEPASVVLTYGRGDREK